MALRKHEACAFYDPLSAAAPFLRSESVEIYMFIRFGECARDNYYILWGLVSGSGSVQRQGHAIAGQDPQTISFRAFAQSIWYVNARQPQDAGSCLFRMFSSFFH